jgi:hypothetical protein
MCVPSPAKPVSPENPLSSVQSATSLELGGQGTRGAAQLGRLQLRFGGGSSAAPATPAPVPVTPAVATPAAPGASSTQTPNVPYAFQGVDGGFQAQRFGGGALQ